MERRAHVDAHHLAREGGPSHGGGEGAHDHDGAAEGRRHAGRGVHGGGPDAGERGPGGRGEPAEGTRDAAERVLLERGQRHVDLGQAVDDDAGRALGAAGQRVPREPGHPLGVLAEELHIGDSLADGPLHGPERPRRPLGRGGQRRAGCLRGGGAGRGEKAHRLLQRGGRGGGGAERLAGDHQRGARGGREAERLRDGRHLLGGQLGDGGGQARDGARRRGHGPLQRRHEVPDQLA